MICPECGVYVSPTAIRCPKCGTPIMLDDSQAAESVQNVTNPEPSYSYKPIHNGKYYYDESAAEKSKKRILFVVIAIVIVMEMKELKDYCDWIWTSRNGVNGYEVIGRNGSSIFLPAAGYRNGFSLDDVDSVGGYRSRSRHNSGNAWYLGFYPDKCNMFYGGCCFGRSVRAVHP